MATVNNPFETDEVVGVIAPAEVDAVRSSLTAAGFDQVEVMEGPEDAAEMDVEGEGVLQTVLRLSQLGEENQTLERFRSRLLQGEDLVRVKQVGERAEEAGKILADHDGELVWHYGKWTYRELHHG